MNHLDSASNDLRADERPPKDDQRHLENVGALDLGQTPIRSPSLVRSYGRLAVVIVIVFWLLQYTVTSILVWAENPNATTRLYLPRSLVSLGGVVISIGMIAVQSRLRESSLSVRGMIAVVIAFVAPGISVAINYVVFYHIYHFTESGLPSTIDLVQDYVLRLWYFGSLSGIILALSYAADVRDREERIGRLQALAHSAQIRALRNQLNPHFLFNALNSISGLISAKRVPDAEIMTEDLADFLRLTLALDPQQMITLDQELHLQRLYLSIEKVRFPDRLHVEESVPDALRTALVPSLITQPLIENSIKYAVARSTRRVELRVSARASGEVLEITVSDSGGDAVAGRSKGARLGLTNVAERVHMHYGEEGHFIAEPEPSGGFRNVIRIPLQVEA